MIDALYPDAPKYATQEQLDEMHTLHEAKRWGYVPGETPGTAEDYVAHWRKVRAIDASWRARFAEARERGAINQEIRWMNRQYAAEIHEMDEAWLRPKTMRGRIPRE